MFIGGCVVWGLRAVVSCCWGWGLGMGWVWSELLRGRGLEGFGLGRVFVVHALHCVRLSCVEFGVRFWGWVYRLVVLIRCFRGGGCVSMVGSDLCVRGDWFVYVGVSGTGL